MLSEDGPGNTRKALRRDSQPLVELRALRLRPSGADSAGGPVQSQLCPALHPDARHNFSNLPSSGRQRVQSCQRGLTSKAHTTGSGARVQQMYVELVANGALQPDERQSELVRMLSRTLSALADGLPSHKGASGGAGPGADAQRKVKGLYVYGEVGSGKSMAMDLFWKAACSLLPVGAVRRVHFHEFMMQVHADLHAYKLTASRGSPRAIPAVAERTAQRARVLCLDEFQVTDIADAAILAQLMDT
jgi:predicted ATPase